MCSVSTTQGRSAPTTNADFGVVRKYGEEKESTDDNKGQRSRTTWGQWDATHVKEVASTIHAGIGQEDSALVGIVGSVIMNLRRQGRQE